MIIQLNHIENFAYLSNRQNLLNKSVCKMIHENINTIDQEVLPTVTGILYTNLSI